ncbi:hypothetical protein TNCV_3936521 [Trichonephila clavipes]|nr:hypothetical protein TNCV_3936521 [Trichonephila clavipes]
MPREGAFHHLIIVSYPRQDERLKENGCAIQHDFMLLNVRYVTTDVNDNNEPDNIRINETFLGFIEVANQTAKSLESDGLNFLNTLDINLAKYRGQGYDGAANRSGARHINLTSKALQSPKIDLENAKTMLNSSLTSIEDLRNNFANIKEAFGLAKKWVSPRCLKKRDIEKLQFFDDFNADEKLQDRERLFEVDVFKANIA